MSKFSVKKPLTVLVAVVIVLVLGFVSFSKMTPDLMPNMDMPYVIVMTTYPGATPEEVEQNLTKPLEQSMGTLDNISEISSTSSSNYSTVVLQFTEDVNMDTISVDILQKINMISDQWDDAIGTPYILKINPNMIPVSVAAVSMDGKSNAELSSFLNDTLLYKLESTAGVASVTANGTIEEKVNVILSQEKIDALNKKIQKAVGGQFQDAESKLDSAQDEIDSGKTELENGKEELEQGRNELSEQTAEAGAQLNQEQAQLNEGKNQIKSQISALESQLDTLKTNEAQLQEIQSTISTLEPMQTKLTQTIEQLDSLQKTLKALEASESAFQEQINAIDENSELSQEEKESAKEQIYNSDAYKQTVAGLATIDAQLSAMGTDRNGIDDARTDAQKALEEVNAGLSQIDTALSSMGTNREGVSAALEEISAGKAQISSAKEKLEATLAQLEAGEIQLQDAMKELEKQKTNAIFQLSDASTQLLLGESTLTASANQVAQSISELESAKEQALKQSDLENIITMDMVSKVLAAQNFSMPVGYVQEDGIDYLVSVGDEIQSEEEMKNLVIVDLGLEGIDPIRLSDVAEVFLTDNSDSVYANINGNDGILLSFSKQSTYATADVSNNINAKFQELTQEYEGLTFTPLVDQGEYIYTIINSIIQSLILGAVFAILILFLFLKDIKPTFIILCSIPISVVFAFVLMYFSGITLNMISMSGLAVAVGMLVDNSVVVIENIYRLRAKGASAVKAAIVGASQVAAAIASSTLTTICVFLPIIFVEGITRQLFTDMALTMAFALIASLIVALTLVPAMSSRMLRNTKPKQHKLFDKLMGLYTRSLKWALRFKPVVLLFAVVLLVGSGVLAYTRGFVFMPESNATQISLELEMPENAVLEDTKAVANEAVKRMQNVEGIETVGAMLSSGDGNMLSMLSGTGQTSERNVTFYLTIADNASKTSQELTAEILEKCSDLDATITESAMSGSSAMMGGLSDNTISIRVYGNDLETLQTSAKQVAEKLRSVEGTTNVLDGVEDADPAIKFVVDKDKAMSYGLTVAQVYQKLSEAMTTETPSTTVQYDNNHYDVIILDEKDKTLTPDFIKNYKFTITKSDGTEETVAIGDVADFVETETLSSIQRVDQTRYIDVTSDIENGYNISLVTEDAKSQMKNLDLPNEIRIEFDGGNEDIMASMSDLIQMILLGILLVYLIMVAQFQSLKHPFIVMFTIPLAFTGGLLALLITGMEISVISMIGFVMLCGIIVNNGIVLVDYINQLRLAGVPKKEALLEAGVTRMRPILMTTITTILGLIVMALGIGTGSDLMQPIAIVCIGGLIYATLLTLYIIPIIYDLMNRKEMRPLDLKDLDDVDDEALERQFHQKEKGNHFADPSKESDSDENLLL